MARNLPSAGDIMTKSRPLHCMPNPEAGGDKCPHYPTAF
jgi:hypothetical protein